MLDHLHKRMDQIERKLSRAEMNPAPTVPQYDLQGVAGTLTPFQYVLAGAGATSSFLNSDVWYTVNIDYTWTSFSSASVHWTVGTFDSGSIDWSGVANPGKCTGITSVILPTSQPGYFVVKDDSGPGGLQDEAAFYSEGLLTPGLGGEILGNGTFSGSTVYANAGITNAAASNSCTVNIDIMVPTANGPGMFSGSDYRVIGLSAGDGGGLSTGVFLAING